MTEQTKFVLTEDAIPTHWVNLLPDLPGDPLPPLNPGTMEPAGPDDLTPIFPMEIIGQEVSSDTEVEIPERGARRVPAVATDSALPRAPARACARYARAHLLQVRGRLTGRLAQAEHRGRAGVRQQGGRRAAASTETGAGQWGSALALACSLFGLECVVYMVGASYDQKPYRRAMMESWGATVIRSPSDTTEAGRARPSTPRARSASRSPRRWRWPPGTRARTTRSARC